MKTTTWRCAAALGLVLALGAEATRAGSMLESARPARLQSSARLSAPRALLQQDTTLACFEGLLSPLLNPACFDLGVPPHGDCASKSSHFLVQRLVPDLPVAHRVVGIGFISNDDNTVFPSAGVIPVPFTPTEEPRLPTPSELASLQASQVATVGDTSVVFVDLGAHNILVQPGGNVALYVALQFPEGGTLSAVGVGPGIAADGDLPDQECDFFTVDDGMNWWLPFYDPSDHLSEPLDWGFVVLMEPATPVRLLTWTQVKSLYRTP